MKHIRAFEPNEAGPVEAPAEASNPPLLHPGRPAFLPGVRILTREGAVDIGRLQPGDQVMTRDHGLLEIRSVVRGRMGWAALGRIPALRPIEIQASAFAPGLPVRSLRLSPDHGVVVQMADGASGIVAARRVLGSAGVSRAEYHDVECVQIVLDRPAEVNVEGLWCTTTHARAGDKAHVAEAPSAA